MHDSIKPQRDHSPTKFPIIQGTITPAIVEQFTYLIIVHPVSQSSVVPLGHKSSKTETTNGGHRERDEENCHDTEKTPVAFSKLPRFDEMARKSIGLSDRRTLRLNFSGAKTSNEDAQSG